LKIFDAHIRSEVCSDADLKHLSYFGTAVVITTSHDARSFESAADLIEYFEFLLGPEATRLGRCGLEAYVALGVLPTARPRRTHYEVWRRLPAMLDNPVVVAVGEVGVFEDSSDQWELFETQARMAREARKPLIVTSPAELRINQSYKMMQRLEKIGVSPSQVMINYTDERFIENVLHSGFYAGLAVGAATQEPRQAARWIAELLHRGARSEQIVINSALRVGGADVLAIPKTIEALGELGVPQDVISAMVWDNAENLFLKTGALYG
jgi:uncharacterized protein